VAFAWAGGKSGSRWTPLFLWMTVATSVTGFFFPFKGFTPAMAFGVLSLVVLAVSFYALKSRGLVGKWRPIYLITALFALYLNTFVLIVQSFQKVPALKAIAPTQTEPPFGIAQASLLALFVVIGVLSVRKFPRAIIAV